MERLTAQQIENLPEWMTIPDYPSYEVNCRKGIVRNSRNLRVLKPSLSKHGYPYVRLYKDGKGHNKNLHRIVALAAFEYYNISTYTLDVCHLDEERNDPRISNLALGSHQENMNFEKAKQRISESLKGYHHSEETRMKMSEAKKGKLNIKRAKRVGAYKNGELIMIFQNTKEAVKNGFNQGNISSCCTGKLRTHKGYEWRFLDTTAATMVG